jgi:ElaA protein
VTISVRTLASPADWEAAKAIRFEVFVDEQHVPADLELDELDAMARHWLAWDSETAIGTARAVRKDFGWKIGRVAVRRDWRGRGVGLALMRAIIDAARRAEVRELQLESQTHALAFYERLGFVAEGPEFDDAGIPHRLMRLALVA